MSKQYDGHSPLVEAVRSLSELKRETAQAWEMPTKLYEPFFGEDSKPYANKDNHQSNGGPSGYYDFPKGALTLNDVMEYLAEKRWGADSLHLKDVVKAAWRWGGKAGTEKAYDCRKIIYSACRLLMKYQGVDEVRATLQGMLDDEQFKTRD